MNKETENLIEILKTGGIAVIPTDTIYGIVACAENEKSVEKIYSARQRASEKPCIILISRIEDLDRFNIRISKEERRVLSEVWPGPVSVILECYEEKFKYLHRGTNSLAFRMPKSEFLENVIKEIGPLLAPSANIEGEAPAQTVEEAINYFGEKVSTYIDGGKISGKPSKIIKLHNDGSISILRE